MAAGGQDLPKDIQQHIFPVAYWDLIRKYSARLLTNPEANVRMGTAHFADLVKALGGVHLALAAYNAGETPVHRWLNERQGLTDREEFIHDIPYPETQNYVKRILGTAEDYRRLYGTS